MTRPDIRKEFRRMLAEQELRHPFEAEASIYNC